MGVFLMVNSTLAKGADIFLGLHTIAENVAEGLLVCWYHR